jgi:hypothetical protein
MFHLIMPYDPATRSWTKTLVHEGNPLPRVREILGGRWTSSSGRLKEDMAAAFWNGGNGRKVFVMAMPAGLPLDAVYRIAEARE